MKIRLYLCNVLLLLVVLLAFRAGAYGQAPYDRVDPQIGTDNDGNTFPGASLPFGMIQWSPDTVEGLYRHRDSTLHGLSLTHTSGAGCPILNDFPLLPWSDVPPSALPANKYQVGFTHEGEIAKPGFYAVTLADGTRVELVVTERAGIARLHFLPGHHAGLFVNEHGSADTDVHVAMLPASGREHDGQSLTLHPDGTLTGTVIAGGFCHNAPSRYTVHLALRMQNKARRVLLWKDRTLQEAAAQVSGRGAAAWLDLGGEQEQIVKVGLSWVSEEGAVANLNAEIPDWDFAKVQRRAMDVWAKTLDRATIDGASPGDQTIFYTALYHEMLAPNLFSDRTGEYRGFDQRVHRVVAGQAAQYATFSDWDIYRNTAQIQAWLQPRIASDMAQSLVNDGEQIGYLPRWPLANASTFVMGGDSQPIVVADYYAFGATNFDTAAALRLMLRNATVPGLGNPGYPVRDGLAEYLRLGYLPIGRGPKTGDTSASESLEFASSDFAISEFAAALGKRATQQRMLKQAGGWRNLLDPETRWIRPRYDDGRWLENFDAEKSLPHRPASPLSTDQFGFEEGNTFQYTFMIPFDYNGLFQRIGTHAAVEARLDRFFKKLVCWGEPCFNMANEPDFVTPYAYTFLGKPYKTAEVVTRICNETFNTGPGGIPGNDDLGATSGVYVWNSIGMYPAIPGKAGVVLGTPRFPQVRLRLGERTTLHLQRVGQGMYVQSVVLNGMPWPGSWLPLSALHHGANEITFTMGERPGTWATAPADLPPSLTPVSAAP